MIKKIIIKNYRAFKYLALDFNPGMNIVVGDNDAGKSTLVEAINLALTSRLQGKPIIYELSPYLFNFETTQQYVADLLARGKPTPPEMVIDVFLEDQAECAALRGSNNLANEDALGIRLRAVMSPEFKEEYERFIQDPSSIKLIPTEYYVVEWLGFSGNGITARSVPATASLIDASAIKLQSGADYYLQNIITSNLDKKERVELARAYRSLREDFANMSSIAAINTRLTGTHGDITNRAFTLSIDLSPKSAWESNLIPHLDELPFQFIGNGEQNTLKILLALARKVDNTHIVLVEEPENHLSFSSLNVLVAKIAQKCKDKQVIVTTHSSYVLNKLGMESLILLSRDRVTRLTHLPPATVDYFKKLSGYDTLRLVLAKRVILVEGPSDELVVQRAYRDQHGGRMPIEDGVDVINVRGLSAKRFLDIAVQLERSAAVVTDNDGNTAAAEARYADYAGYDFISIHVGQDDRFKTLEPQLLAANGRVKLNKILGKSYSTDSELLDYMQGDKHKTTCALKIFESTDQITMPGYIRDAISP